MTRAKSISGAVMVAAAVLAFAGAGQAAPPPSAPAATAPAADPKAEALVRRYLAAVNFEHTMDAMQAAMLPVLADQMSRQHPELSASDRAMIVDVVRSAMREKLMPRMIDRLVPVYAATFTIPELEALVAFYESPTGRSITEKVPSIAPKSAEIMRELMPAIMVEVVQEVLARKCPNGKCAEPEPPKPRSS